MTDTTAIFNEHADRYNATRRRLIPPYDRFYGTATEAVGLAGRVERVLDLGAGTGLFSAHIRAAFPESELVLTDGAEAMLEQARELLGEDGLSYVCADLADELPGGPWDAIVSALAVHHLEDDEKRRLFARVHGQLRPGGVFVNAEQIAGASRFFDSYNARWHEQQARAAGSDDTEWAGAVERMAHDDCSTVEAQLAWLREAGFGDADCLLKDHRFAVIVARR